MLASTIREYGSTDKPSYVRTHAHMHPRRVRAHNTHRSQHICEIWNLTNFMKDEKLVDLNKVKLKCIPEDGIDEDEQPVFFDWEYECIKCHWCSSFN